MILQHFPLAQTVIENKIRSYASRKRPCVPNLATIQFLKARIHPHEQLYYVTFQDTSEQQWFFTYFLSQLSDGSWYIASGSGSPHGPIDPPEMQQPSLPWLRIKGNSVGNAFHAGGEVIDNGFDIVRVRLVTQDGIILEDTVEDGLVLFRSENVVIGPMQAELYGRVDNVVHNQSVFTSPLFPPSVEKVQEMLEKYRKSRDV